MPRRHDLSDVAWDSVKNLIPGKPGRTGDGNRRFLNAVLYVARPVIP